jgi:hypothetical protein
MENADAAKAQRIRASSARVQVIAARLETLPQASTVETLGFGEAPDDLELAELVHELRRQS